MDSKACWLHLADVCAEFHEEPLSPPPCRSKWPKTVWPSSSAVQFSQVSVDAVPSANLPVTMSCRPAMAPVSVSAGRRADGSQRPQDEKAGADAMSERFHGVFCSISVLDLENRIRYYIM